LLAAKKKPVIVSDTKILTADRTAGSAATPHRITAGKKQQQQKLTAIKSQTKKTDGHSVFIDIRGEKKKDLLWCIDK